jgi:uncharacterized protein (TIGR02001 family)
MRDIFAALVVMVAMAAAVPASAQAPLTQAPVTVTGGVDVANRYMFRGLRQNAEGAVVWPWVDLGIGLFTGGGRLKAAGINVGTWSSLHTATAGEGWYEADLYASFSLSFSRTVVTTTYTSYTSPNDTFSHVKEVMVKAAVDDSDTWGIRPYGLVAFELGAASGLGQADGGTSAGTYLEIGLAPVIPLPRRMTLTATTKFGLSLDDYYELPEGDSTFGYSSVSAALTVPLGAGGHWNVRGGVEYQGLGTTARAFNGGDQNQVIGSVGIGFTY